MMCLIYKKKNMCLSKHVINIQNTNKKIFYFKNLRLFFQFPFVPISHMVELKVH